MLFIKKPRFLPQTELLDQVAIFINYSVLVIVDVLSFNIFFLNMLFAFFMFIFMLSQLSRRQIQDSEIGMLIFQYRYLYFTHRHT